MGNILEMIVMIRHILVIDSRTVLRTILGAGMLAVLLVLSCAGTAQGLPRLRWSRCYEPLCGDLNRDGHLTPADAAIALEIAVDSRPCDPTTLDAADVSGADKVTSLDALMIMQAAAGRIEL